MMNPMSDPVTSSLMSTGNQMSDPALIQSIFKVRLSLPFSIHSRLEHFLSLHTTPNVGFFRLFLPLHCLFLPYPSKNFLHQIY